jgi:hypothetical protein
VAAKKTARMRWPAIMLASSRTARVTGRTTNVEMNSIGVSRGYRNGGTSGGNSELRRYRQTPCRRMPIPMNSAVLVRAMTAGRAMRAVTGKLSTGTMPERLARKMNTNKVVR